MIGVHQTGKQHSGGQHIRKVCRDEVISIRRIWQHLVSGEVEARDIGAKLPICLLILCYPGESHLLSVDLHGAVIGNTLVKLWSGYTGDKAAVVPTRTVLQAFAAMFVMDADASLEENVEEMTEAIADVRGGEVTTAVRDSQAADGSPIHAGDVMGIEDDAITVVGSDVAQVTLDLINRMQEAEEGDTLTILAGSDLSDEAFEALTSAIEEAQPELEIDAHRGEQPLYPVVFSLE